jgi:arsenate reductase-like glutaredoxin family protein
MITIYSSPTCGNCRVIKKLLMEKNIQFSICEDIDIFKEKFNDSRVPKLDVDGIIIEFGEAYKWIRTQ